MNKRNKKLKNKLYSIIFLLLAIVSFVIISIPMLCIGEVTIGILFIIFALINIYLSKLYRKRAKECSEANTNTIKNPTNTNSTYTPVHQEDIKTHEPVVQPKVEFAEHSSIEPIETDSQESKKKEHHRVAGISFHTDELLSLAMKNYEYEYTKKEMLEYDMINEPVFEYSFPVLTVDLLEEPDNEYDPNAIKVVVDGVHIGYIKKGSCSHIKKLLREDRIEEIHAFIGGGKRKCLVEKEDDYGLEETYVVKKETRDYFCELTLILK